MNQNSRLSISQEGLKFIACLTMLIDHIGAIFFPSIRWLRIIGRVSFPLYAFLLAEGLRHSHNLVKYGLRLLLVALISELPYDLLFSGKFTWTGNSVMVTLLLSFLMGCAMKPLPLWAKPCAIIPFALLGQYCHGSYGMRGVLMVAIFLLPQNFPRFPRILSQALLLILLSIWMSGWPDRVTVQIYAIVAIIPLALYSGRKHSHTPARQWFFTLFYPLHLIVLLLIRGLIL